MLVLVTLLFFINIHFILFLHIKENINLSQVKYQDDENANNGSSSSSYVDTNSSVHNENETNYSFEYENLECSADLGTWYSKFMDNTWFWVDIIVYFLIPFITMCITFSIIKFKLKAINRNYACILLDKGYNNYNKRIYSRKIKRNNKIIYSLFGTNLYFCLSIIPFSVFTLFKNLVSSLSLKESYYLKSFVEILFYSNNALNIVFYGFTSKDFRKTFKKMFRLEEKSKKSNSSRSGSKENKLSALCKKTR